MSAKGGAFGEFGRIERYFRPLTRNFPGALGLMDDAAIISVPNGQELVVTTDAIVSGVHFLPADTPFDIARKALRVNLSDLAAKGARPLAYTLTLAIGRDAPDSWVEEFAKGLEEDQARFGIALIGGDSVSTPGPVWVSITAFGLVRAGQIVRRNGARDGDRVFVTGTIGDAALGLKVLRGELSLSADDADFLVQRYRLPEPRSAFAQALAANAHAALDISDGLAADFDHLCRASNVSGAIAVPGIPLSRAVRQALGGNADLMKVILGGGDDYELLLTAPAAMAGELTRSAALAGIALTEIGRIEVGKAGSVLVDAGGAPVILDSKGWTHS
jgi:thiamine-monophosphate kinase